MEHGQLIRRSIAWGVGLWVFLLFGGCGDDDTKKGVGPEPDGKDGLVGLWVTEGIDPDLGAVNVSMTLHADGRLAIVQELPAGARLSFSGTWAVSGAELTLTGVYFKPNGQRMVRYQLTEAGLELAEETGKVQLWRRAQ